MKKNRKKNILFSLILILTLFFGNFKNAQAVRISFPDPKDMLNKILDDLGFNKSSIQDAAKLVNNAQNKNTPPTTSITFAPTNPKEGEKITATAVPLNFFTNPEKMYYTWMLKSNGCLDEKLDGDDYNNEYKSSDAFKKCDLNEDNEVDIEDYKIKAARIIANDDIFDWKKDNAYANDTDNDGYKASFGGDDQNGKTPQCFLNDIKTGEDFPIDCDEHFFPKAKKGSNSIDKTGNGNFERFEEEFWRTDPTSRSTGQTKNTDEANVCGLGIISFSWNYQKGDKIGVIIEGTEIMPTQTADASYKTVWAKSGKNYEVDGDIDDETKNENDGNEEYTDVDHGNGIVTTLRTEEELDENDRTGNIITVQTITSKKVKENTTDEGTFSLTNTSNQLNVPLTAEQLATRGGVGGPYNTDIVSSPISDSPGVATTIDIPLSAEELLKYNDAHPDNQLTESEISSASGIIVTTTTLTTRTAVTISQTDPFDPDNPTYNILTQTYTRTKIETETNSIYYELYDTFDTREINAGDFEITIGEGDDKETITRVSDLNDPKNKFLYNTLISPSENSVSSEKLNVQLSYSPTLPLNDPSAKKGDMLSFNASASNAQDNSSLKYYWEFFRSDSVNEDDWAPILKDNFPVSSQTQTTGLGLDSFKLKLDFPEKFSVSGVERNFKFLKAKLTIKERVEGGVKEGRASVIIPIESSSGKIETYSTTVGTDLGLSRGGELCSGDKITCQVTKSSIVSLSLSETDITFTDFLWTVDGKNIKYKTCPPSINCNDSTENEAFFPITKEVGQKHTVNLVATNEDGDKIELSKTFQIVDPKIKIIPENILDNSSNCKRIVVGNFIDLDGSKTPDYSKTSLLSAIGSPIKIKADVIGFSPVGEAFAWNVNGNSFPGQAILELPAKEVAGDNYSVSVNVLYSQNNATKQALSKYWGISADGFYEKTLSDKVDIVLQNPELVTQKNSNKKIFASLSTSTPEYLAFLLRIILTTFLIIFVSKLVFAFSSETRE